MLTATNGLQGIGECYGLPSPAVTSRIVDEIIAPLVIGEDALAIDVIWSKVFGAMSGGGHLRGFYLEAMSGVDIALWDLKGKALGLPIHRLLGGPHRELVPVYASPVPMCSDPDQSARMARNFVDQGFRALKLKLGRGRNTDLAHARAVRAAIGDDIELLVDLNCAYTSDIALPIGLALAELGITWFEEPLAVDDLAGYQRLRSHLPMSLVNGETLFTRYDFREYLVGGAVDVIMPNVARAGGLSESLKIAALAGAFHVDVAPHGVGSAVGVAASLHLSAAIPNFRTFEFNQLPNPLRDSLTVAPFQLVDGCLPVPEGPGLGIELDWDRVAGWRTDGR
ncbi:mandelate racemase/muconate lactonizing enzyme family protein [Kribbella aluminosa]